nr:T9SS type A sorting domain-containing protein [Gammaproteobacteria bacterium]NIW99551.1 T9SS type A sorting domain-containing protein [Phycisphaerae bacterium]
NWFRDRLQAGTYSWPANGTNLNVNGFTRDESGTPGQVYTVNPRDTNDIEILTNPPVITDVERNPGVPTSSDDVNVSAAIVDNGTVDLAQVHYSINWGSFQQATMTATQADTFQGTIPSQSDGDFVRYFVSATDNDGESSTIPGDTSLATGRVFFYTIRDAGLSISDVQNTYGYAADNSGYEGYEVTLQGVVMTDSTDFVGDYWIQDADTAWSGIWVNNDPNTYIKGDMVEVTGTVEENFNVTRLDDITGSQVMTPGAGVFSAVPLNTGDINTGGPLAENFESVLVKVSNLTVTDPFPDDPSNFGEFTVDDGSGGLRVDDFASAFSGNLDSTYGLGDQIDSIVALHYYSFGDYKLIPRDSLDIHGHVVGIGDEITQIPSEFELFQNYPNPFNPSTKIRFNIAKTGQYKLAVFNVLGQKVRTLSNQTFTTGQHEVQWNGRDEFGNQVGSGIYFYRLTGENIALSKKMILLK